MLEFQDGAFEDPFLARYVSDGIIKMLAYLVLLHEPKPHPLSCVEEPEKLLKERGYTAIRCVKDDSSRVMSQRRIGSVICGSRGSFLAPIPDDQRRLSPGARRVGPLLDPSRTPSKSFEVFCEGIRSSVPTIVVAEASR